VCKESRDVVVGDLVFDSSISSRALEVIIVRSKDVVTSLKGKDETFQFCLEKKRLVFWDSEVQDKLKSLYDKRGDLHERTRELDETIKSIEESFIGCE
jgi:hypothetical protein